MCVFKAYKHSTIYSFFIWRERISLILPLHSTDCSFSLFFSPLILLSLLLLCVKQNPLLGLLTRWLHLSLTNPYFYQPQTPRIGFVCSSYSWLEDLTSNKDLLNQLPILANLVVSEGLKVLLEEASQLQQCSIVSILVCPLQVKIKYLRKLKNGSTWTQKVTKQ